jgi:hypothetical protein
MPEKPSPERSGKVSATVVEASQFYLPAEPIAATHLVLRWRGRTRFTVPVDRGAQAACWRLFQPGRIEVPLRLSARLPQLFGAMHSVESETLALIRKEIGRRAGASCCRAGAPGPWKKDTILLLDDALQPLLIVKAGKGEAVERLLRNEAEWLSALRDQPQLSGQVPEMVASQTGPELSFVAQTVLPGHASFEFGEPHAAFLREFQASSRRSLHFEESRLYHNLQARMKGLDGLLTERWRLRLERAMRRMEEQLCGEPILMTAAHNDFTPWNIRIEDGVARIFDWELAEKEQLPLFDPLHFTVMPMALKRSAPEAMVEKLRQTIVGCESWLGPEQCRAAETQALAYMTNLCTLYLWSQGGRCDSDPVMESYARVIDLLNSP